MSTLAAQRDRICLRPGSSSPAEIVEQVYQRVCRVDFVEPGFCVLALGDRLGSHGLRQYMVVLKDAMSELHERRTEKTLTLAWATRFDQQNSTKPHVDAGPEQNLLMLGYEPTSVASTLEIYDFAKCAYDLGISPTEYLMKHNPMFQSGRDLLVPYTKSVPCFNHREYMIVLINNSVADYSEVSPAWQGTLHTATVPEPDELVRRVINSFMIVSSPGGTLDAISSAELEDFALTTEVHRRGYDKQDLERDE